MLDFHGSKIRRLCFGGGGAKFAQFSLFLE